MAEVNSNLIGEKDSKNLLQKIPSGVVVYWGSDASLHLVSKIVSLLKESIERGESIRYRNLQDVVRAFQEKRCIYALSSLSELIGFTFLMIGDCGKKKFLERSSLLVRPDFRGCGIGKMIKQNARKIADTYYPGHDLVSIVAHASAVYHMNLEEGFKEVTFQKLWDHYGIDMVQRCDGDPNLLYQCPSVGHIHECFKNMQIFNRYTGQKEVAMMYARA